MKKSSLLSLCLLLLLAAASPLAGAWSQVSCGSDSSYAANSTYEANLRRLETILLAEASASPGRSVDRAIGYWPNRVRAVSSCGDGDCAACIVNAFKMVEIECPFRKEAFYYGRNCSLSLGEVRISGSDLFGFLASYSGSGQTKLLVLGMMFQAIGLACLFVKFLQAWRHGTKN